jgi:hypothetical protein
MGFQSWKLDEYFGKGAAKRELGYIASEAACSIPFRDDSPEGILAVEHNYYEFMSEGKSTAEAPRFLGAHELQKGENYKVVITNESGLYRYDINDVIRVTDFYRGTPVIVFERKSGDMLNITGEKMHVNHFMDAFGKIKEKTGIGVAQFRAVSIAGELRYEIYLCFDPGVDSETAKAKFLPVIDAHLAEVNPGYGDGRNIRELFPPRFHIMKPEWEENIRKKCITPDCRDTQYKWKAMSEKPDEMDRAYIIETVE